MSFRSIGEAEERARLLMTWFCRNYRWWLHERLLRCFKKFVGMWDSRCRIVVHYGPHVLLEDTAVTESISSRGGKYILSILLLVCCLVFVNADLNIKTSVLFPFRFTVFVICCSFLALFCRASSLFGGAASFSSRSGLGIRIRPVSSGGSFPIG